MRTLVFSLCLVLASTVGAHAQQYRDPYPVESLAIVLGKMHFLDLACNGNGAQTWRQTMMELLEQEAPARGAYRDRLIENFNGGFREFERRRMSCGAESEIQREHLARQGIMLSEQLRRAYLD